MSTRGEKHFIKFPKFAANLYDYLMSAKAIRFQINEIAEYLVSKIHQGRLLDVGTGHGRLLIAINKLNPKIELYGLDISESMIQLARKNLAGIPVDIRWGNIRKSDYNDNFFDIVTCTGSFYLWDHPEEGLEEIYRILKFNHSTYLFETYREHDKEKVRKALKSSLRQENLFIRLFGPFSLKKQLSMTYKIPEIESIIKKTSFKNSYKINKITLSGLPIWLRIELKKSN